MEKTMEKIVALAKNRGFVYPGSEIYGGLAITWDYGNLGVELKNNVKKAWWQKFITESPYNVGVDCAILMNSQTWVASGHLGGFSDPLMDCKQCKERFRADKLIEDYNAEHGIVIEGSVDGWSQEQMKQYIEDKHICCPSCGAHDFTDIRQFNLMFKTFQGVTEDAKNTVYLRPETAQGIFVNFKNVQRTSRKKVPFGIGQIGKSFRNEITPGNFTFRTREFEQMELEFFCKPDTDLGTIVIKEALNRAGVKPEQVDEVYMGCVLQAGQGQNVARQAAIHAGIPVEVPATTVNVLCGSGLHCVNLAAKLIASGDADIIVAGGTESMSRAPYLVQQGRYGYRMGNAPLEDALLKDALTDAFYGYHMGMTAENICEQWGLTREQLDEFAANSQQKCEKAMNEGRFKEEIVPVEVKTKKPPSLWIRMKAPERA